MLTSIEINRIAEKVAERILDAHEEMVGVERVAQYMGKSIRTIQEWCRTKDFPHHRCNGSLYFRLSEINRYIKEDRL